MADKDLKSAIEEMASKYDNMDVLSSEYDEEKGQLTMKVSLAGGPRVAELPSGVEEVERDEMVGSVSSLAGGGYSSAAMRRLELDPLTRMDLDLAKPSILTSDPQSIFARSIDYYRTRPVYGSAIIALTNFASKGFENDIDDENIKNFFDNWVIDVKFDDLVEKIFFDFFRAGMVRTYKVMGKYEPKINYLSSVPGVKPKKVSAKALAAKKNRYSASHIPIGYTILNPIFVVIKGSLMFGQTATFLKKDAGEEIKVFLEMPRGQLTEFQRKIVDSLPASFKDAIKKGDDIPLDPELIGEVDYRRMPYERYPLPRGSRAFEALEFHDELRKADYSTLDGITNYVLKITVGNDKYPIKKQETLERVSDLFDTVSKSYKVVWDHTLDIEKVTTPEIGEILGPDKYKQVNGDITGALGMVRALIDGLGEGSVPATELAVKSVIEEINYARRQVSRWIYSEYATVAKAMGFDRIPKVRFDDMALRDEIQMMTIVQGMIDRRIISYRTGQKKLGFDPETELAQMRVEYPLIQEGVLGLTGSPFQQSGIQTTQRTPKGTPSEGRPKGAPAPTPRDKKAPKPSGTLSTSNMVQGESTLADFSLDDLKSFIQVAQAAIAEREATQSGDEVPEEE